MFKCVIKITDWKEYLSSLYFNPTLPSSYLGPEKLYQFVKSQGIFNKIKNMRGVLPPSGPNHGNNRGTVAKLKSK